MIVILKNKLFNERNEYWDKVVTIEMFRDEYPRYPTIDNIEVTEEEKTFTVDLRPFMNPATYTIQHVSSNFFPKNKFLYKNFFL